ncbi:signal peptidase I [Sphaceloma murrayae]|uniref:Signal peptidase I n=1 Tax=Sphaceloma murrayae TaxID=2082308 RepID=A0A2K1QRF6_9PEZI|nr:signal peptidase I [Sphaceloma murrayae]
MYTKTALGVYLAWHIFSEYFYTWNYTWGISMLPNLAADGDAVILSKYYRHGRGVKVGDLVSFVHPVDEETFALKRVLGMPGDFVMRDSPHRGKQMMIQVPAGHCYVVGDNLEWSRDSRLYGPLPMGLIRGKALCKINWGHIQSIGGGLEDAQDMDEID